MLTCGSLFTGIEGLDMAVTEFFGAEVVWVSEVEKPLLDRYTVPNLGDVTKVDWSEVEPVDILCGGYPCQPFSSAGQRQGFDDPRDLWPAFARAIRILRPRYVVAENVAGHLRLGFERTLRDLAEMGFDARWGVVRASDAGAPHRRERIFLIAQNTKGDQGRGVNGESVRPTPHARCERLGQHPGGSPTEEARTEASDEFASPGRGRPDTNGRATPNATSSGRSREPREDVEQHRLQPSFVGAFDFGPYRPAIERWERVLNRLAPKPIDDRNRLTPSFVEWMQGMPAGHTDGLSRTQALKALGNCVVPQQALLALELLCGSHKTEEYGTGGSMSKRDYEVTVETRTTYVWTYDQAMAAGWTEAEWEETVEAAVDHDTMHDGWDALPETAISECEVDDVSTRVVTNA